MRRQVECFLLGAVFGPYAAWVVTGLVKSTLARSRYDETLKTLMTYEDWAGKLSTTGTDALHKEAIRVEIQKAHKRLEAYRKVIRDPFRGVCKSVPPSMYPLGSLCVER